MSISNGDPCVSLMQGTLVRPVPRYPSSIAGDDPLKVASNRVRTSLARSVASGDTLFTVGDASRIVAQMLLSVDSEIVSVSAISGNILTVIRGFDGTQPSAHSAGSILDANIVAWHHNALAAEITAIETALGTNLSNISGTGGGAFISSAYDWAQTIGGNLIIGNNVITLAPVPKGVNGSDVHHWLYISGGTGAAEAVLITGGTAVAGAASGTIIVNCANTHSGAWTIRSATAGIQEVHQVLYTADAHGAEIRIPPGIITLYGPVTLFIDGLRIIGTTRNHATGYIYRASGILFDVQAGSVEIGWLALKGGAHDGIAAPAGNIAITTTGLQNHLHDLMIDNVYGGIELTAGLHSKITNIWGRNCAAYLIKHSGGNSPFIDTVTYMTDTPYEVPSQGGIVINSNGAYIYNIDILLARNGILIEPVNADVTWTFIYDARCDMNWHAGVCIRNTSAYKVRGVFIHDLWAASTGFEDAVLFTSNGLPLGVDDGVGLIIGEGLGIVNEVTVDGGEFLNNRYQNVKIFAGGNMKLSNLRLAGSNQGNATGIDNVYMSTTERVEIAECEIRAATAGRADYRSGICAANGDLTVRNNRFVGPFTSAPVFSVAPAVVTVDGFNRGMDDTPLVVPSASTLTLGPGRFYQITGTTTVSNIQPAYAGRIIILQKTDAGALIFDTSGNLQSPTGTPGTILTLNTLDTVRCEFWGSKWIIHK